MQCRNKPWNTMGDRTNLFSIDSSLYDGDDDFDEEDNGKLWANADDKYELEDAKEWHIFGWMACTFGS